MKKIDDIGSESFTSAMRNLWLIASLALVICGCQQHGTPAVNSPASKPKQSYFLRKSERNSQVIIFIHGIFGSGDDTWKNDATGAFWPKLITQDKDFDTSDVYVVNYYSPYVQKTSTIEEISQRLLQQFRDAGIFDYDQIYIVAHSMGGLISKRMLVDLNTAANVKALRHFRGVLLISTPSQGATIADIGTWISFNPQLADMKPADLNTFLQSLDNQWSNMLRERDAAQAVFPRAFCAYETRPVAHGPVVVSRIYQNTRCDNNPYPIDLDHIAIAKPSGTNDDPYPWAKRRILETSALVPVKQTQTASAEITYPLTASGHHDFSGSKHVRASISMDTHGSITGEMELENDTLFSGFDANVVAILCDKNTNSLERVQLQSAHIDGKLPGKAIMKKVPLSGQVVNQGNLPNGSYLRLEVFGG